MTLYINKKLSSRLQCLLYNVVLKLYTIFIYYMGNPVLGKFLCSDRLFLGQDFAVRTVSMETVQSVYFSFGAKLTKS